jgi:energy-coupling factor transporter ATP-binding protein EcfA2
MSAAPMIELRKVVKTFKNAAGEFTVLKGIDLTLYQGEFVAIVGKSGSGKSTLLNMMTGIDHPSSGQVVVNSHRSVRAHERVAALAVARQEYGHCLPVLPTAADAQPARKRDAADGLRQYVRLRRTPTAGMELLKLVGLESTGQQTAVCRFDRPATGCGHRPRPGHRPAADGRRRADRQPRFALGRCIINLFQSLADQGKTIVMVTHDPSLTQRTSRTIIIADGELIDEAVAQALPLLNHRQMLSVTQTGERRRIEAGRNHHPARPACG